MELNVTIKAYDVKINATPEQITAAVLSVEAGSATSIDGIIETKVIVGTIAFALDPAAYNVAKTAEEASKLVADLGLALQSAEAVTAAANTAKNTANTAAAHAEAVATQTQGVLSKIWKGTQTAYNMLVTQGKIDANTLYFIYAGSNIKAVITGGSVTVNGLDGVSASTDGNTVQIATMTTSISSDGNTITINVDDIMSGMEVTISSDGQTATIQPVTATEQNGTITVTGIGSAELSEDGKTITIQ